MEKQGRYKFNQVSNLKLFDIKAQKKTIPFKKFCRIPLTYEESLKENFEATRTNFNDIDENKISIIVSKKKQEKRSKRQFGITKSKSTGFKHVSLKEQKIEAILKKCSRLIKTGSGFKWKFNRFEKGSRKCLEEIKQKLDFLLTNQGGNYFT